jgi:zinc transport system substrate-binding protein
MKKMIGAAILLLMTLGACGGGGEKGGEASKPKAVTAFYPLEFVAKRVAAKKAEISNLTPAGVEPHDLDLTSGQIRRVKDADLLIYLGKGFQPAVEAVLPEFEGKALDALQLGGSRSSDPHVWLDPVLMVQITNSVADTFSEIDKRNKSMYKKNAEELVGELNTLDDSYQNGLSRCERRELVTSHEAFGYLAARFNLEQVGISGIDPDQEPSAQRLKEVSDLVKKKGITTIFFENLLPPDLAETVARETGATTAQLDPIESAPEGGDYLSAMRSNLAELRKALNCQ